jgi:5-dehydro-2-deoxygluconokinase
VTALPELLTVGRVGVDLYPDVEGHPEVLGIPLEQVTHFARYLGGTATNVAVGAARLGRRTAVLTKVGADPFGGYVRTALAGFGVDPSFVGTAPGLLTPVVFCALDPPEDPPLLFYRRPIAPDLTLTRDDVPWDVVRDVPVFWVTGTGVSADPARSTQHAMLEHRGRPDPGSGRETVLDLDWRSMFWESPAEAREQYGRMLEHATVAVGNRDEVEVAVGTRDPLEASQRLLDLGVRLAIVKRGPEGVLARTRDELVEMPPVPVDVVCGLGAGDAFGGALVHGLLHDLPLERTIRLANAAGSYVAGQLACADAMPTISDLEGALV